MRLFTSLILIFIISTFAVGKVAYIPITDFAQSPFIQENKIIALDLETGTVLRRIFSPSGYFNGSVFLNSLQTKLYAGSGMQITTIDTTTFEVESFLDLPAVVEEVFLSQDDELYYISNNSPLLYKVDLNTNVVSIPLDFGSERIKYKWVNTSLNTVVFYTSTDSGQSNFRTYDLSTLNEKYTNLPMSYHVELISNDGEEYFYTNYNENILYSRKLSDNSINWTFSFPGENQFPVILENEDNSISAVGYLNTYKIDRATGSWQIHSNMNLSYVSSFAGDRYNRVNDNSFLVVNYPEVWCLTGWCGLLSDLNVSIVDVSNNSQIPVYHSELGGSYATGKYIGEKFYSIPIIPILNNYWLLGLLLFIIILIAYRNRSLKQ